MWITYSKIHRIFTQVSGCQNLKVFHREFSRKSKYGRSLLSQLCDDEEAISTKMLKQHPVFKSRPDPARMKKCANILQNAGYSAEYIRNHLDLLSYPPAFLKNCLYFCKEYACFNDQIGPAIIDFGRFMNLRISTLKECNIISPRVNVLDSILYFLKIPKNECDVEIDEMETVQQIYWKIFHFYFRREMQIDEDSFRKMKREDFLISFRLLQENLYLMRKSFGFTNADLVDMPYLLRTDPENTISILNSARGVNLKEVIVSNPRLLTVPSQNIQIVNNYLIKNGMDFNLLLNDPDVLRLDINTLMYRLVKLIHSPSLSVFKHHPRLGNLLQQSRVASERMIILKKLDMDCYDLDLLTCSNSTFLKHVVEGIDRTDGNDVVTLVSQRLSVPVEDARRELRKNEGLEFVPLSTVIRNLDYLLEMGFSKEDIFRSSQILLYPRHVVQNQLSDILINSVVVTDSIEYQVLNKKYFLPLSLYYIEKESQFTESGIFSEKYDENSVSLLNDKYVKYIASS